MASSGWSIVCGRTATIAWRAPLRRRRGWAGGFLIAGVAAIAVCTGLVGPSHAATVNFAATIDGPQVPSPSLAIWSGTFVMDTMADTLSFTITDTLAAPLLGPEILAHIHGFALPGVNAGILFPLPLGSPKVGVWNFSPADEPNIIAGLTYVNIHTTVFPNGEIRGQILRVPSCGDGIVDGGEQCDDGNTDDGDCCDSTCQFEPAASLCTGASLCDSACDALGNCVPAVRSTCGAAGKAALLLKNNSDDDTKDKLVWKWLKGAQTTLEQLGVPTATTAYALCIYSGTTAAEADIPAGSLWQTAGTKGFKYKDPNGTNDGVTKALLKSGDAGKAKALVKGKGMGLPDLTMPLTLPVTVQLVNSDNVCFGTVFGSDIKNDSDQFKAKTP